MADVYRCRKTPQSWTPALVILALLLVATACGTNVQVAASDEGRTSPTSTSELVAPTETPSVDPTAPPQPSATANPSISTTPTLGPVAQSTLISAVNGFVTLSLLDGWTQSYAPVERLQTALQPSGQPYVYEWEFQHDLIDFTNGNIEVFLTSEPLLYTAPDYRTWRKSALATYDEIGLRRNIEVPLEWAGGSGDRLVGTIVLDTFVQIDTVEVNGIKLMAVADAVNGPTDIELVELRQILSTLTVDRNAIPLLSHAVAANRFVSVEETGSTPFTASFLVPGDWVMEDSTETIFESPDGEESLQILLRFDTEGLDRHVELALEEFAAEFLGAPEVRTSGSQGGIPIIVLLNDVSGRADRAVIMASDGVVFMATLVSAAPALLEEILDSVEFPENARG